jgi:hypothetical protein
VSESIGRRREWKNAKSRMLHSDVCPALRSADYKIPKNVWEVEYEESENTTGNEEGIY